MRNDGNKVLRVDDDEFEDPDKSAFENFMQGLENIDKAMEAMIDNYTDGVENLSEENGLEDNNALLNNIKQHT